MRDHPGVFDQTGGQRIRIRARTGSRCGKLVQRSLYLARIGNGLISDNGGSGLGGFLGVFRSGSCGIWPGFFSAAGIFFENFFVVKKFWFWKNS